MKNEYLIRQRAIQNELINQGRNHGEQWAMDLIEVVLHQQFGWGYDRIKRLIDAVSEDEVVCKYRGHNIVCIDERGKKAIDCDKCGWCPETEKRRKENYVCVTSIRYSKMAHRGSVWAE